MSGSMKKLISLFMALSLVFVMIPFGVNATIDPIATFDGNAPFAGAQINNLPDPQTVSAGSTIEEPSPYPSCSNYNFGGWYKEATCENPWSFSSDTVDADTILFASWVEKTEQDISFDKSNITKTYGDNAFINALSGAMTSPVIYESTNTNVATVEEDGQVTILKAGDTTITATAPEDGTYASATASYILTVEAKTLFVAGTTVADKGYDGTTNANVSAGVIEGVIGTDDVTISAATGTFDNKNVGEDKAVTVVYTLSGDDAMNYTVLDDDFTADITPKALTVSGTTVSDKTYDGTTDATVTAGVIDGVVEGDDVTLSAVGTFADSSVGEDKGVTVTYILNGADAGNYEAPADGMMTAGIKPETTTTTATTTTATATTVTATATTTTATATTTTATATTTTATATTTTATATTVTATETTVTATATKTEAVGTAVLGDANGDGAVTMKDVLALRKYLAGHSGTFVAANADVNGDGELNMKDVLMLRKYLAGLIASF